MKIDFYVYNTHEIIVWENIIRALIGLNVDAKYILEAPILNKAEGTISNKHNNWVDDKSSELQKLMTDDIFAHCSALIMNRVTEQMLWFLLRVSDGLISMKG